MTNRYSRRSVISGVAGLAAGALALSAPTIMTAADPAVAPLPGTIFRVSMNVTFYVESIALEGGTPDNMHEYVRQVVEDGISELSDAGQPAATFSGLRIVPVRRA